MSAAHSAERSTVLVTTAGSPATSGTILRIRELGYRVVATDIDPAAPGLYLADRGCLVPPGDDEDFLPRLRKVCRREGARAVVPLVDEELASVGGLEEEGISVLLPRPPFVSVCLDKYALMRRLESAGIGVPATRTLAEGPEGLRYPLIVKPRSGRGSRGVAAVRSPAELDRLLRDTPYPPDRLLLQERLSGTEFTVSVVVWRDGEPQAVVPKEVILKRGVTRFAVTRRAPGVQDLCRRIQHELGADGPFNVQLALDDAGRPRVFEINPRFSSTTALTLAAGVDEVGGLLGQALFGAPPLKDEWRPGLTMVRHSSEAFLEEEEFASHGLRPAAGSPALIGRDPGTFH